MTWYANNIYARWCESLEATLLKSFNGSVYRIEDLKSHSWWKSEIIHGIPKGGLLSVWPISNSDEDDHLHSWYDETVISWEKFISFENSEPDLIITPDVLVDAGEEPEVVPHSGFLKYIRKLARDHSTPVTYYQSFMWGGDTESEFAFVYSGYDEFMYLFTGMDVHESQIEIRKNSMVAEKQSGEVLVCALKHLGLEIPSPYFAPHTRSFPWSNYKIKAEQ